MGPMGGGGVSHGVAAAVAERSVALWRARPETVAAYAEEVRALSSTGSRGGGGGGVGGGGGGGKAFVRRGLYNHDGSGRAPQATPRVRRVE